MIKLTEKENQITNFIKDKSIVYWQELTQFSKDPGSVKLSTIKKSISELRRKFIKANEVVPFDCEFKDLMVKQTTGELVLLKTRKNKTIEKQTEEIKPVIAEKKINQDFKLDKNSRKIFGKYGGTSFETQDNLWYLLVYLFDNAEKEISLEELRDKVFFQNWGSKIPARWFSTITRNLNELRKSIPAFKERIKTIRYTDRTTYKLE